MLTGQAWSTVVKNNERTQDTPLVSVDEDVLVLLIVTNRDFSRDSSTSASGFEVANQILTVLVNTIDVTVNVNSVAGAPVFKFTVDIEFIELFSNFDFTDVFRNINHLSCVLHKTTVLTFRCLVWTQAAPLSRVQVTCFEVRLASNQW